MKKCHFLSLIFIVSTQLSYAQMQNIKLSESTVINRVYAGLKSNLIFLTDTLQVIPQASFRIGTLLTQRISNTFQVESQAFIQLANYSTVLSIPTFELIAKLNDKVQLRIGHLITPTTTLRPNPTTWQSQVETYAQTRITGAKPGANIRYAGPNLLLEYGIHNHAGVWANHFRVDYKKVWLAGYVLANGEYFIATKITNNKVDFVANYSSVLNESATSLFYNLTTRYTLYTDLNYKHGTGTTDIAHLGVRSYYENTDYHVKGFFGIGYDIVPKLITAQFFIHLH
jgi:hypothetical protein